MRRMALALAGLATLGLLLLAGCSATTKLTNVWGDPAFQTNSLKKLMVLGVAKSPSMRRTFEETFVGALQKEGVEAMISYPLTGDFPLDSATVTAKILESGCDGIFVTRVVDRKTVETYYPPTTTYIAAPAPYYGGWYGYSSMGYAYESSPGYTVQSQVINLETNLYRVSDAKLVWSALSESWLEQSDNPAAQIGPFVDQLVYGLTKSKIVAKK